MKTVKSFSKGDYGILMVQHIQTGMYRVITTNSKSVETSAPMVYSKASEYFDNYVYSILADTEEENLND